MNGLLLRGLKDLVVDQVGDESWTAIHERADLDRRLYMPASDYADQRVLALVEATVAELPQSRETLLMTLGRSLVPELVTIYGVHIREGWTALELLGNVDCVLRGAFTENRFSTYEPPRVTVEDRSDRAVELSYTDDGRELCALFAGILDGIGDQYDVRLVVEHRRCHRRGGEECRFRISRLGQDSPPHRGPAEVGERRTQPGPRRRPQPALER